jgi:hypothetical protein
MGAAGYRETIAEKKYFATRCTKFICASTNTKEEEE